MESLLADVYGDDDLGALLDGYCGEPQQQHICQLTLELASLLESGATCPDPAALEQKLRVVLGKLAKPELQRTAAELKRFVLFLVGKDRGRPGYTAQRLQDTVNAKGPLTDALGEAFGLSTAEAVSYTHLTLPTILLV